MKCPDCGRSSVVLDTRKRPDGSVLRRRRCSQDHTFSSVESVYYNRQRHPLDASPMSPEQFKAVQAVLGLTNRALEIMLRVSDQTIVNWRNGHSRIPGSVAMLLSVLSDHAKSSESRAES